MEVSGSREIVLPLVAARRFRYSKCNRKLYFTAVLFALSLKIVNRSYYRRFPCSFSIVNASTDAITGMCWASTVVIPQHAMGNIIRFSDWFKLIHGQGHIYPQFWWCFFYWPIWLARLASHAVGQFQALPLGEPLDTQVILIMSSWQNQAFLLSPAHAWLTIKTAWYLFICMPQNGLDN